MSSQPEFGSDSFLDIVANIVGILIILIVVAGVKVARMPVHHPSAEEVPVQSLLPESTVSLPEPVPEAVEAQLIEPEPVTITAIEDDGPAPKRELPPLPTFEPIPNLSPPEDLLSDARKLQDQIEVLATEETSRQTKLSSLSRKISDIESHSSDEAKRTADNQSSVRSMKLGIAQGEQDLNDLERSVTLLKRQLKEAKTPEVKTVELTHHLPPLGRVVTGKEIHFRLAGNKVSYVPVLELAERVKGELDRKKDYLMNRPFYQGTIGPLDGYLMDYVIQRQSLSLVEEMRMGRMGVRIALTGWVISPTAELIPETQEQALKSESDFLSHLREATPTSTVTFWVYPDSFEIHGELKSFIHELGLWVASRPLPDSVPIAGSPQGSKSLAQ